MKINHSLSIALLALLFFSLIIQSQGQSSVGIQSIHDPSTITLKITSADRLLSTGKTIEKHNSEIHIEAFADSDYNRAPLFISNFTVDLVRNGRLIASTNIGQHGHISYLLENAEHGDIVNFRAQETFLEKEGNKLELFSNGTIWFYFEFVNDNKLTYNE